MRERSVAISSPSYVKEKSATKNEICTPERASETLAAERRSWAKNVGRARRDYRLLVSLLSFFCSQAEATALLELHD